MQHTSLTQNELIAVMGKHMVLQGILEELNASSYYSILVDEVTFHNVQHIAICVRFVDENKILGKNLVLSGAREDNW